MSHLDNLLHRPNLHNLLELYRPIRSFGRHLALADPQSFFMSSDSRRDLCHDAPYSPDSDLYETTSAFFLQCELPGTSGRGALKMHWLDGRTLQIQGDTGKTDLKAEWDIETSDRRPSEQAVDVEHVDNNKFDKRTSSDKVQAVQEREQGQSSGTRTSPEQTMVVRSWLKERRTGVFVRTFYLPSAVDTNGIRARLSQGLLEIVIPKMRESVLDVKEKDIEIETTEY
jgi:HSP20 family protein